MSDYYSLVNSHFSYIQSICLFYSCGPDPISGIKVNCLNKVNFQKYYVLEGTCISCADGAKPIFRLEIKREDQELGDIKVKLNSTQLATKEGNTFQCTHKFTLKVPTEIQFQFYSVFVMLDCLEQ